MNLIALPAFFDNCIWKFHDGRQAVVVDPVDAAPVLLALATSHLTLAAILVTHRHADHVGGDCALATAFAPPAARPALATRVPRGQQPTRCRAGGLAAMRNDF